MQSAHQPTNQNTFTSKFFESNIATQSNVVNLRFPLPEISQAEELASFFKYNPGFKAGLAHIIDSLYAWLEKKGSSKLEAIRKKIEKFQSEHIKYEGANVELNATLIYFYRYGTPLLYQIRQLIEDEANIPLNTSKTRIENFFLDFVVCGPAAFTHVQDTYSDLSTLNTDVPTLFKNIRTKFAKNILQQFIQDLQNTQTPLFKPEETGLIIHYIMETIKCYAASYGLFDVENHDPYKNRLKPNKLEYLINNFVKLWDQHFLKYFLGEIIHGNLESYIKEPQTIKDLTKFLNQFGDDEGFNVNSLFDQDALADDRFEPVNHAMELLKYTLVKRLQNTGYINCFEAEHKIDGKVFVRSTMEVSYFYEAATRMPFWIFAYEALFDKPEMFADETRRDLKTFLLDPAQPQRKENYIVAFCRQASKFKPVLSDEEANRLVGLILEWQCENWKALLLNMPIACVSHYLRNKNEVFDAITQDLSGILRLSLEKRKIILEGMLAKNLINLGTLASKLKFNEFKLLYESINPEIAKALLADPDVLFDVISRYEVSSIVPLLQDSYTAYLISPRNLVDSNNIIFSEFKLEDKIAILNLLNPENVNKILGIARGELRSIFFVGDVKLVSGIIIKCDQSIIVTEFGEQGFMFRYLDDMIRQPINCAVISKLGAAWFRTELERHFKSLKAEAKLTVFCVYLFQMRPVDDSCYSELLNLALDCEIISNLDSINKIFKFINTHPYLSFEDKKATKLRILMSIKLERLFLFAKTFNQGLEIIAMANQTSLQLAIDAMHRMQQIKFTNRNLDIEKMVGKIGKMELEPHLQMQVIDMVIKKYPDAINQKIIEKIFKSLKISVDSMPAIITSLGEDKFVNSILDIGQFFRSFADNNTSQSFYIANLMPLLLKNVNEGDLMYALGKLKATDIIKFVDSVGLDFLISKFGDSGAIQKIMDLSFDAINVGKLTYEQFVTMGGSFAKANTMKIITLINYLYRLANVNPSLSKSFLESCGFERIAELLSKEPSHYSITYKNRIITVCKLSADEASRLDLQSTKEEEHQAQGASKRKNEGDSEERENVKVQKTSDNVDEQKISITQLTLFAPAQTTSFAPEPTAAPQGTDDFDQQARIEFMKARGYGSGPGSLD